MKNPSNAQFIIMLKRVAVISCAVFLSAVPAGHGADNKPATAAAKTGMVPPPPVEGKTFGFFDIEAQKFELGGKVVRVEITGKILGSEPIGGDMVRAMVKDTATRYGQVEFPRAGTGKTWPRQQLRRQGSLTLPAHHAAGKRAHREIDRARQ